MALARQFLDDAGRLLDEGRLRSATSRAYYAAYHAAIVLFEKHGFTPGSFVGKSGQAATMWEHPIVTTRFFHEFVQRRKLFSWRVGQEIRRLYSDRLVADYEITANITPSYAAGSVNEAQDIVEQIERWMSL
jgi:uncharacterized protein (UPF0332 family)